MINTYIPENRIGWWGGIDERPRCQRDDKVAIPTKEDAEYKAQKINERDKRSVFKMEAYKCKSGCWHVGHSNKLK